MAAVDNKPKIEKTKADGTRILAADDSIQKKVGNVDFDRLISPEVMERAQEEVDSKAEEFEATLTKQLADAQAAYMQVKNDPSKRAELMPKIQELVLNIKSNAGMFKYELASLLAWSLYNTLESLKESQDAKKDAIAQSLIRALQIVFLKKMKGDGGPSGKALIQEISQFLEASKSS